MSLFTGRRSRWAIRACAVVLVASTAAQSCYYPDGSLSGDSPCTTGGGDAACCGSSDFCLSGGLCLSGGVVMRKTCTDKSWGSDACTGYCRNVNVGAEISITPCSSSSFVCGLNGTLCEDKSNTFTLSGSTSIVLRASQVAALVQSSVENETANATATCTPSSAEAGYQYTSGQMAGLGCALGFPLALALLTALLLLRKERAKHSGGKNLMYKLPDNYTDYTVSRPPGPLRTQSDTRFGAYGPALSRAESVSTVRVATPVHMRSFGERYEHMKGVSGKPTEITVERHELDTALPQYSSVKHASMVHEIGSGEIKRK